MTESSYSQKQIRKEKKKAREATLMYQKTQNTSYLMKRDEHNDLAEEMERNILMNKKNKEKKIQEATKSDDQLLNEAIRQNRRERNEREAIQREKEAKEKVLREERERTRQMIHEKKLEEKKKTEEMEEMMKAEQEQFENEKKEFISMFQEKNPNASSSTAHKEFVHHYKVQQEVQSFKNQVVQFMISNGGDPEKVSKDFDTGYDEYCKSSPESDIHLVTENFKKEITSQMQFIQFRSQTIQYMIQEKGLSQEEAVSEFQKVMRQMETQGDPECNDPECNDPGCEGITNITGL